MSGVIVEGRRAGWERPDDSPFASWPIWAMDDAFVGGDVKYPEAKALTGTVYVPLGSLSLNLREKRFEVRFALGLSPSERSSFISAIERRRNRGEINLDGVTFEMLQGLSGTIEIHSGLGVPYPVVRCSIIGCDRFMGWHFADPKNLISSKEPHTANDLSSHAYRCRLVFDHGVWVPDVHVKAPMRRDPASGARALAEAIQEISSVAAMLNESQAAIDATFDQPKEDIHRDHAAQ